MVIFFSLFVWVVFVSLRSVCNSFYLVYEILFVIVFWEKLVSFIFLCLFLKWVNWDLGSLNGFV